MASALTLETEMFSDEQKKMLSADLDKKNVRTRQGGFGKQLSYIEAWHAIAEANRIFGHEGWDRETIEMKLVNERETGDRWAVSYIAKVRVAVIADGVEITREGYGAGHGLDKDLGRAHESALKEAESDAMKRALMTFGFPFGLALYDPKQEHVSDERPQPSEDEKPTKDLHVDFDSARSLLEGAAKVGMKELAVHWKKTNVNHQRLLKDALDEWKTIAIKADIDRQQAEGKHQ